MSQVIPEETLNQIQSQVNIVDIVSQYVSLKNEGRTILAIVLFMMNGHLHFQ